VVEQSASFFGLGIAPKILDVLEQNKFTIPTPIQMQAIPTAIEGKDVIGIAQTGTGKTLAFGIPMLQRLGSLNGPGLVLLPTRELAIQVDETLQKIGRTLGLRTAVLIGGASMHLQKQAMRKRPHVIVATPGRLIDLMDQKAVSLRDVRILVLDEADRMLDMGFAPQLNRIFESMPKENRQTMLFSATMPDTIVKIAAHHMQLPVRVEVARAGTAAENVTQEIFFVDRGSKGPLLESMLSEYRGSVLVFSRTKHGAKKITRQLREKGFTAAEIHSNRSLFQRREALQGFKTGRFRVLVATDIAARGIDVTGIELVLNYDLPDNPEDYVHRIGRTGRAGKAGHAISFATPDQKRDVRDIERLMRGTLPVRKLPHLPAVARENIEPKSTVSASRSNSPRSNTGYRSSGSGRPYHQQQRSSNQGSGRNR